MPISSTRLAARPAGVPACAALAAALLSVAAIWTGQSARAQASEPGPSSLPEGLAVLPPSAFLDFCRRSPDACGVSGRALRAGPAAAQAEVQRRYMGALIEGQLGEAGVARPQPGRRPERSVPWDGTTRDFVEGINRRVNALILPRTDLETYGVEDYWRAPTLIGNDRFGDCEDYALKKREVLVAAGIPADALSLAIARLHGEAHAVLILATDQGDLVLDNMSAWITPWAKTGYRWEARQLAGDPFRWVKVGQAPVQTLATAQASSRMGGN